VSGDLEVPAALLPEKNPGVLRKKWIGVQSRSAYFGEEEKSLFPAGFEPRIFQPLAYSLYLLLYSISFLNRRMLIYKRPLIKKNS
jgi:hypothetical protein